MRIVPPTPRLIRRTELQQIIGLSRSTIYDRMDPLSTRFDENFPRPVKLGRSAVGWLQAEVDEYVDHLVRRSRGEVTDSRSAHGPL